jgi:hypothetical protein
LIVGLWDYAAANTGSRPITERLGAWPHGNRQSSGFRKTVMKKFFENPAFGLHLPGIFNLRPTAPAASSELRTRRRNAPLARRQNFENFGANVVLFFRGRSHKEPVAFNGIRYKNRLAVIAPCQSVAAVKQFFSGGNKDIFNF